MPKSKHALSDYIVREFCELCDRAHEYWLNHLGLFDNNPRATELMKSFAADELRRLSIISHEYSLLQIVKLHDRAATNGNVNLGIDYVLKYGDWSGSVRTRLEKLEEELRRFADQLLGARNKILSHNDLATIVAGTTLGEFAKGDDEKYFNTLQEFVKLVYDEVIGGPWEYDNLVKNDVAAFLATIKP